MEGKALEQILKRERHIKHLNEENKEAHTKASGKEAPMSHPVPLPRKTNMGKGRRGQRG